MYDLWIILATLVLSLAAQCVWPIKLPSTLQGDDGVPLDTNFWPRASRTKLFTLTLLLVSLALTCFTLGEDTIWQRRQLVYSGLAWTLFWSHCIYLNVKFLKVHSKQKHVPYLWHLTAMTAVALCLLIAKLFTEFRFHDPNHDTRSFRLLTLKLILAVVACLCYGNLNSGPPLYQQIDGYPEKECNISKLAEASVFSYLTFGWAAEIIRKGNLPEPLTNLPLLISKYRAKHLFETFSDHTWTRGLFQRILWMNRKAFAIQGSLALFEAMLYYLPAFFLQKLVSFLESGSNKDPTTGILYCAGLLGAMIVETVVGGQLWFISNAVLASSVRAQLNTFIYAKALRRKDVTGIDTTETKDEEDEEGRANAVAGASFKSKNQVLNLFSVDVDRVADFANYSFTLIDAPAELLIGTLLLYRWLGIAGVIGILVNVVFLPLNHFTSKAFATTQDSLMAARDKRVSTMSELLSAIRMVKHMAWEAAFEGRVNKIREEELKCLKKNYTLEVIFDVLWSISPVTCVVVAFGYYTKIQGQDLTPSIAFASLAAMNELRFALNALPEVFVSGLQSIVSLRRIEAFLGLPEVSDPSLVANPTLMEPAAIFFRNATISWPLHPDLTSDSGERSPLLLGNETPRRRFMLNDISIDFVPGQLNLVTGQIASGKTLLLLACLGEAEVVAGQMSCPRSATDAIRSAKQASTAENWINHDQVAYVPQNAWLQNASIRENILFGSPFVAERYQKVISACSLLPDFSIMDSGDMTEVGERGISLSGGQKQRLSLARAVYSRAGVLLLDDVLSAVDATTAKHIFEHCLKGEVLQNRTVVLVSHHTQLCAPAASYIVVLGNSSVLFKGDRFALENSALGEQYLGSKEEKEKKTEPKRLHNKRLALEGTRLSIVSGSDLSSTEAESSSDEDEGESRDEKKAPRKLVEEETRSTGRISKHVWLTYLSANGNILFWLAFSLVFLSAEIGVVGETLVLRYWSQTYDTETTPNKTRSLNFWLGLYTAISIGNVFIDSLRYVVLYLGGLNASSKLHQRMLNAVLRAKMRFFDKTALGVLTNRFGKDLETIDSQLADNLGHALMYALGACTTILSVAAVAPIFLIGFSVLALGYYHYGALYSTAGRELRRLDSVSKTPIYSLYSETISGVAVIRAFGASSEFMADMLAKVDRNLVFYFDLWASNRWLSARFQILSSFAVALTGLVLVRSHAIDASLAGFALTFALNISNDCLFLVRRFTALELSMVAVERASDIAEIPSEDAQQTESQRPPAAWPHAGQIDVSHLYVRYDEDAPDVLQDVTFSIAAGQRIGVVGPTGSGKSSLAASFFRFQEAHSGSIYIDGLDISKIPLFDLRSRISMIAQDPTIFSGTLRGVLDVFNEHEDKDIYDCLRRVYLLPDPSVASEEDWAENKFSNLEFEVKEQGANFSSGERQLICMAQALLARHKIMILDEATSSVDYKTDELISSTITQGFQDITLLVIAHRLRTVISFDKILLLDAGKVIEYDSPANLLDNVDSRFFQLCASTGPREFKILKKMASDPARKQKVLRPKRITRKSTKNLLG